mgnify:FL=1
MKREAEILGANVPRPASFRDQAVRQDYGATEEEEPALRREVG